MAKPKKPRKVPKMILPKPIAARYNKFLQNMITMQLAVVKRILFPSLPGLVDEADIFRPKIDSVRNDQDWIGKAQRLMVIMNLGLDEVFIQNRVEPFVEQVGEATNVWEKRQWNKMMNQAIGVTLVTTEPWLKPALDAFTATNVALIRDLNEQLKNDINRITISGIQSGKSVKTIRKELLNGTKLQKGRFKKTRTRAELISVDQVLTFNAQLNEMRQTDVGVKDYVWRNSDDERVRGNPSGKFPHSRYDHWTREGKKYSWKKPPPDGHPGQPIRCRCYAEPFFNDILDEI